MGFLNAVSAIAEEEGHHPDLHLTGWRKLRVDLSCLTLTLTLSLSLSLSLTRTWPERVRPDMSTMVPEIITGSCGQPDSS